MTKKRRYKSRRTRSRIPTLQSIITPLVVLTILWAAHTLNGCDNPQDQPITQEGEYGNLMAVVTNPSVPSQFKSYTGMDLSFNARCHIPNWVSWELTADETTGDVSRTNKFYNDPEIDGCPDTWDYSYSGYDRGHMAPAGDMKWDSKAMEETFFLSNICPQVKSLNTGSWKNLEEKCRLWAQIDGRIYIVCGPVIDNKPLELIGDSKVWVPKRFFKVIIAPYSTPARGIGFIMPNGKVEGGMQACAVTIDEVERVTGHDFFASLPDELENELESQCNFHQWSTMRK
ncbi:MAG: DNA/RNA non-specific endonuclease [Duncaniella sp.]|nr:DNA/RNA non-specific endonuclease [Duncaniella sp.]